jgi:hypothetical protein
MKPLGQIKPNFTGSIYGQVSVYLAKWFKRKRFLEID